MSRLFEALQRFQAERSGAPFSAVAATATEIVEAAEREGGEFGGPTPVSVAVSPGPKRSVVSFSPPPARDTEIKEAPERADSKFGQLSLVPVAVLPNQHLVTLASPESLGAEKFRLLAVRISHLQKTRNLKKLLVTSTMAEEGKSLVAANLAVALARRKQQKVLLLEGDLRRPSQAQMFGLAKLQGLSEWLRSQTSPVVPVYQLNEVGVWLMPAGSPPENPPELMQSRRLPELLEQLNNWFDWIVIDSPPVLPIADTSLWIRLADGILLVSREGKTEKAQLKRGLEAVGSSNLVGVVINSCTTANQGNYYQRYCPPAQKSTRTAKSLDPHLRSLVP